MAASITGTSPAPRSATLEVQVGGLRNARGLVQLCVTADSASFPDCRRDPAALKATVAARDAATIRIVGVAPGRYAVALLHDENANGRMDTVLGVPREGYGFSRDAPVRFGPPSFGSAAVTVGPGANRQTIRMRYLL